MSTKSKAVLGFGAAICLTAVASNLAFGSARTLGLTTQQATVLLGIGVTLTKALR